MVRDSPEPELVEYRLKPEQRSEHPEKTLHEQEQEQSDQLKESGLW